MLRFVLLLAGSAIAQQVYTNDAMGIRYTAPAGWVYDAPTVSDGVVSINPTRAGLAGRPRIAFWQASTIGEAYLVPPAGLFKSISQFFDITDSITTKAPTIAAIKDTLIDLVHYTSLIVRQPDQGVERVIFSAAYNRTIMSFSYFATPADNRANFDLYMANWKAMLFTAPPAAAKPSAAKIPQDVTRSQLVDILGRTLKGAQSPTPSLPR